MQLKCSRTNLIIFFIGNWIGSMPEILKECTLECKKSFEKVKIKK